jgi:hypothetical protein
MKASRIRKPLARFKVEGVTHVVSEKRSLTTGGLIEAAVALRYAEHVISGRIFPGRFLGGILT